jgi:Rod binding domain-containing protein
MVDALEPTGRVSPPSSATGKSAELTEAAREFESLLLHMMIKAMRQSVERTDLFGDGQHRETYEMLQDQELAKSMARGGGVGFADLIVRQFEGREEDGLHVIGAMGRDLNAASHSYQTYGAAPVVLPVDDGGDR